MAASISPEKEIQSLIDLVSNTIEAHTTALFMAPAPGEPLSLLAYQSLSRNINLDVKISPGEGLIGWVYKNKKPVNVDQFDQDTRRLFLYNVDESIKSFMAVPLPNTNGVLTVDSKQRYVFTEKSQKILHQFGQALEMTLERVQQTAQGLRRAGAISFLSELDKVLARREQAEQTFRRALALIRIYVGAGACFLAIVLPGDRDHYMLLAYDAEGELRLEADSLPLDSGLAGWIMREKQPLVLEKARLGTEKSYVFHPQEPLSNYVSFAGFPVKWGRRLHGALCLADRTRLNIDEIKAKGLDLAVNRVAASLEMEFLSKRISELGRLDPQVGLPHRTYFTERLERMMKLASVKNTGVNLFLVKVTNLDALALESGQTAAQEILRTLARQLLVQADKTAELGHLSYGTIGVAALGSFEVETQKSYQEMTRTLSERLIESGEGRFQIQTAAVLVQYPVHGQRAESLIDHGLKKLNK